MVFAALPFTLATSAICGFIFTFLTVKVILLRYKHKQAIGDINHDDYLRKNSVHSNFANTAPLVLILIALAEINRTNPGIMFFFCGLFIMGRLSHIFSLYYYEKRTGRFTFRMAGMMSTFAVIIAFSGLNLYKALSYFIITPVWR